MFRRVLPMFALIAPFASEAAAPALIPVTGYLTDTNAVPVDGTETLHLKLYRATGPELWSEDQTIDIDNGQFTVYLGDVTPVDLDTFRDNGTLFLGIAVGTGAEMVPRFELATSPYAAYAQYCEDAATVGGFAPSELLMIGDPVDWLDLQGVPTTLLDGDQDTTYTNGAGLDLVNGEFSVQQSTVDAWARAVAYDSLTELRAQLDTVYAASTHTHTPSDITGVLPVAMLPVGTGAAQVAAGNHSHSFSQITGTYDVSVAASAPATPASGYGRLYGKPYTVQDGNDTNTMLLVHSNAINGSVTLTDSSAGARTITRTAPLVHTTSMPHFGTTGMDFRGGGYFTVPDSADWDFPGDFTIDFWIRIASVPYTFVISHRNYPAYTGAWHAYLNSNGVAQMNFGAADSSGGGAIAMQSGPTIPLNTWTHVAIVRSANTATMYFNGTAVASDISASGSISGDASPLYVGDLMNYSGDGFDGYLDEVRVSKGIARWTANFTPPAAPYDIGGTGVALYFKDDTGLERRIQYMP